MAIEANLTRTINEVYVTLNDQKLREFPAARDQEIAAGATGGWVGSGRATTFLPYW